MHYRLQMRRAGGQSDEAQIISELARAAPRTFVEFGFHPAEFNCAMLARDPAWRGLLIDGNSQIVADARALLPERIEVIQAFLTLENLDLVASKFPEIGVLSIDVDGNDYWFLEKLIAAGPSVICVEYNASLGLEPITVPYDPEFDRNKKHPQGWYHGASLTALAGLCARFGYGLAAISQAGGNAFFTTTGGLDPAAAWKPSSFRDRYSGLDQPAQWKAIRDMPYVRV
jgi:hypothetical protein